MPEQLLAPPPRHHPRRRPGWRRSCAVPALLLAACAGGPPPPAQRVEAFADAYVQLLPLGAVMDAAQAADPRWPLGGKAVLVSAAQLGCMRGQLDSATITGRQRQDARRYALAHPDTLEADLQVLQAGAARLLGRALRSGAGGGTATPLLQGASPAEAQALVAFTTEARYAPLRRATGVDQLLEARPRARERGRAMGQALLTRAMTDAFLKCHIPVGLLY